MFISLFGAVESGLIYAIMALGVYLTFRILDFPDLTVDGSFVTGGAVVALSIMNGVSPIIATILAAAAGFIAGCFTGLLHTKGKINALLSGILMMTALYSINLRIMGQPNLSIINENVVFDSINSLIENTGITTLLNNLLAVVGIEQFPPTWGIVILMVVVTLMIKVLTDFYLKTEVGLALQAIGDNKQMIRSLSANTDSLTIIGVGISNGMVALAGALIAQQGGFADVGMGIGMIVIGLASVIIGEALFGKKTVARATFAVIGGAIIYRIIVTMALRIDFMDTGDMKLMTALIVILSLVTPKILQARKEKKRRLLKQRQLYPLKKEVS
ncbi:MAG: ABC transporter permease [Bacillota bacterium]|uniref:ABC transporter permease n=1 Tax=Virgibacillus TaxID=84406 RepID=UPI00040AE185|nr:MULTISPECIES: ABC transporter permease [Bacillaceae]MCC2252749.1 ABC transporter permease [Virgibacillus sp. AGTR]MDY7046718.1 ABC transporter permease [Virgibacillus sp. M23]QRZ16890.1 ABC transporter permease [Virgibacillus sp. AGTR]WBX79635.1 ABC transporter permease [Virgibacillus salarius]